MHFSRLSLASKAGLASLALALLSTAVQGQTPAAASSPPPSSTITWDTFASLDDRPRPGPVPFAARLLFFRPNAAGGAKGPADVFVNARLHAALLPGGFTEVDVCEGPVRLRLGGQGSSGLKATPEQIVQARAGQTTYVLVQADGTTPMRLGAEAEQARSELPALRRQTHALSRVPPATDCPPATNAAIAATALATPPAVVAAAPTPTPAAPARYTLSAEMLFRFSGSQPQDLSEQGQTQIVRLARQIKQQLRPGQVVLVQGHTDPSGPAALNKRLSQERAETVKAILLNSGLPPQQVRAEGLGATQALVKGCERTKARDDRINCNRPNRRVEITVSSLKN